MSNWQSINPVTPGCLKSADELNSRPMATVGDRWKYHRRTNCESLTRARFTPTGDQRRWLLAQRQEDGSLCYFRAPKAGEKWALQSDARRATRLESAEYDHWANVLGRITGRTVSVIED